jgi:hypothetical protein
MTTTTEEPAVTETAASPAPRNGTALAVRSQTHTLPAKLQYARELASSGLLPKAFRFQPANVLFAIEYGEMLGLPPVAAMMGIYVIDGKPAAYASLISALVRKAGHKLRVGYDESKRMGWATIVRADDPDFTFRSEWDLDRAVTAELCVIKNGVPYAVDKDGKTKPWKKYFPSMTKARAITEVARDACEEALFGLHYTPEELGAEVDEEGHVVGGTIVSDSAAQPADDPWYVRPPSDAAWVDEAMARTTADDLTVEKFRALWTETSEKREKGEITDEDSKRIKDTLSGRADELQAKTAAPAEAADAEVIEGEIVQADTVYGLDPEDDWAAKVQSIVSQEDADAALADVAAGMGSGHISDERGAVIIGAIDQRMAELASKAAA